MNARNSFGVIHKAIISMFCVPMLVAGVVFGAITFVRAYETVDMYLHWQVMSCRITASEATREYCDYFFRVQYTCALDGKTVSFDTYREDYAGTDRFSKAQALVDRYPVGSAAVCYVSLRAPYRAVLVRRDLWTLLLPLVPVGFVVVSFLLFYDAWWGESSRRAKRSGPKSKEHRGDSKAERPRALSTPKEVPIRSWIAMPLFGGLFFVVGLYMTAQTVVRPTRDVLQAANWVETPCQILSSQVREHESTDVDETTTYSVDIFYQYTFAGQEYRSNRYSFYDHMRSWMLGYRRKAVAQHPHGSTSVCYVNPEDPRDAVLERGFTWEALWVLPSSVPTVLGGLFLVFWLKAMFDQFRLPDARWMPKRRSRPSSHAGLVVLKPESTAGGCAFALLIISLICFGVAVAMLLAVLRGWRALDLGLEGSLCGIVMPFPVLLVGGLFAWLYVRSIRALRLRPRPVLCVSRDTLPVGASFDLHWTIGGPVSRIQRLTIRLIGREEAIHYDGDNERMTVHSVGRGEITFGPEDSKQERVRVFYQGDILDTSDPSAMAQGRAQVTVPRGTMHSLDGDHSRIVWLVEVKGDVGETFPVEWEYRILVLPLPSVKDDP